MVLDAAGPPAPGSRDCAARRICEIYCTTEDTGARRVYFDTVTADGAKEYFDSIGFEISDALACKIGIREPFPEDTEMLHLLDDKAS